MIFRSRHSTSFALLISCLCSVSPAAAQTVADSSSFGESADVSVLPILGSAGHVLSGPMPQIGGHASPAYNLTTGVPSVTVSSPLTGQLLQTGPISLSAASAIPGATLTSAGALVNQASVSLGALLPLLNLHAATIQSAAGIDGTCGSSLTANGSSILENATMSGSLGNGGISRSPAPNTVLLNQAGVKIVLNEQMVAGNGTMTRSLTVNGLHLYLQNATLAGLGVLSGDIVFSQSKASVQCGSAPPPPPPPAADLSLSLSASAVSVLSGGILGYTLTATNHGPDAAGNVVVTDVLPAGVVAQPASPSQGSCTAGPIISCNLGSLGAQQSAQVSISVVVSAVQGILVNSGTAGSSVADPTPGNNSASVSTQVQNVPPASADVGIALAAAPNPVSPGGTIYYSLTVTNHGPGAAGSVNVTDSIPFGATAQSAVSSQGSCSVGPTVTCNLGTLGAGASAQISISAKAPAGAGSLVDTAMVSSSTNDPASANNSASVTVLCQAGNPPPPSSADLTIVKTGSANPVLSGGQLVYTLKVTNHGPSAAPGVTVSDTLPAGVTLKSVSPSQGTCKTSPAVVCNLGLIAAGNSAQITVTVTVTAAQGQIVNTATVSSAYPDPAGGDNSSTLITQVSAACGGPPPPVGATEADCRLDAMPAATLLIPYFAVDLDKPTGRTTIFSVTNAFAEPQLAHITLWTDWAVPTLTFDLYLTGYDVETIDLRDVLVRGLLPATGAGISHQGDLSEPNVSFPSCDANLGKVLPLFLRNHLRAAHTGRKSPVNGVCAGSVQAEASVAAGYVTIDSVRSCSTMSPGDPGYFVDGGTGVATNDNALMGDYALVDPSQNQADGDVAVHIRANPEVFGAGHYTFYGRYSSGADNRQPLGGAYGVRFSNAAPFPAGTQLIVWRDTKSPDLAPPACGALPAWGKLGQAGALAFDQQENSILLSAAARPFPWATQLVTVKSAALPIAFNSGWLALDLGHAATPLYGEKAQAWVGVRHRSTGKLSVGYRAFRLDNLCGSAQ